MEYVNQFTSPLYLSLIIMFVAYFLALKIDFFSLVDAVWSYLFTPVALIYALIPSGVGARNFIMLGMVTFWSVRLGTHLLLRMKSHFPHEDSRYVDLRAKWAKNLKLNFFLFFMFQGLSVAILSLPFLLVVLNQRTTMHWLEYLGVAIWLLGVAGESISDIQLKKFREKPENKGKVCEDGLWKYSRHPNYFFEWVIWVGYFVFAASSAYGWIAIVSPLIMLYLLLKVTGVPYSETMSLKSRGDLYRDYQKRVSVFVPWFPKKASGNEH